MNGYHNQPPPSSYNNPNQISTAYRPTSTAVSNQTIPPTGYSNANAAPPPQHQSKQYDPSRQMQNMNIHGGPPVSGINNSYSQNNHQGFQQNQPPSSYASSQAPVNSAGYPINSQPPPTSYSQPNTAYNTAPPQAGMPPQSNAQMPLNPAISQPYTMSNNYSSSYQKQAPSSQMQYTNPSMVNSAGMPQSRPPMSSGQQAPLGQFGMPPNNSGMPPTQPGMHPSQPGIPPPQQGMRSVQQGMPPTQPGMHPGQMVPPGQPVIPGQPSVPPNQMPPGPGQPGMPGSNQMQQPGSYPGGMQSQRRLNPDAMPSPIQVIAEDRLNRQNETYSTEGKGNLPPLITTKFTVNDGGSASPRYIRCTTYNLPATADMAKTCQVPMALSISPLAQLPADEAPPIVVDPGPDGPIRCKRCKAYMCPSFKFVEGGRRFQCVICNAITDTPQSYFDHIDYAGQRVDKYQRAELCRGSYEFLTTKDYCKNDKLPNVPAYIFAIDVSYNAVQCGMVDLLCRQAKDLLNHLPCDAGYDAAKSPVKVGFITYNNTIHFYNLKSSLAQPQVMVVSDVSDVFVPLQDGFLVDVTESRHVIDSLLDQIPLMYADTRETAVVFGPVIQSAVQAMQAAECAGKLLLFHSTMPSGEAPGKLKNRDDRKLIGTDKEKTLFGPASNFYEKLAKECVAQGCSVDLFLFPNQFIDIASIGQICHLTGGDLYRYNFFRPDVDGVRFITDLKNHISKNVVFDAILRVRASTGIRPVDFIGAIYMSNTTDVELAAFNSDKAIMMELKHDDKLAEEDGAFVQAALLYTSVSGQRRLRIHNLNLSVCTKLPDLYKCCENDVLVNYLAKVAIRDALSQPGMKIRESLIARSAAMLACYRKHCASPSSPGQLILPECMKLLPVYLNCILNSDAIHSSTEVATDERAYLRQLIYGMDVKSTQAYFYPRLTPVFSEEFEEATNLPAAVRCSEERLGDTGVYILHNGVSMFLWIGTSVSPDWIRAVFGVQSPAQIDIDTATLPVIDSKESNHLRQLIEQLQLDSLRQMKLTIVRQRDKLEGWFKHFLVEDRGRSGAPSYIDFLCHVHKEVRALLS